MPMSNLKRLILLFQRDDEEMRFSLLRLLHCSPCASKWNITNQRNWNGRWSKQNTKMPLTELICDLVIHRKKKEDVINIQYCWERIAAHVLQMMYISIRKEWMRSSISSPTIEQQHRRLAYTLTDLFITSNWWAAINKCQDVEWKKSWRRWKVTSLIIFLLRV